MLAVAMRPVNQEAAKTRLRDLNPRPAEHGMIAAMELEVSPLDPAAIRAARATIDPAFVGSPQFVHDGLSARAGRPVIVKVETVNPIRSFKGRGTWHAVGGLVGEGSISADHPLVVASTGNFGQGVAYAARAFGVPVTVFADEHANQRKLDRIRAFGATVRQVGHDFDAAREAAEAHARATAAHLLVDGQDARIALGAGTLAVEVTDAAEAGALPLPGTAYVPVGNGALIVGLGAWLRANAPGCRVVGIQSEAAPSMTLSWRERRPIETETAATFADGIASRVPVTEALAWMVDTVDDMRLVSEASLRLAQAELADAIGITVEGAAAASWAAVFVTGSNVPPAPDAA
jgi:threonine dehydratase